MFGVLPDPPVYIQARTHRTIESRFYRRSFETERKGGVEERGKEGVEGLDWREGREGGWEASKEKVQRLVGPGRNYDLKKMLSP